MNKAVTWFGPKWNEYGPEWVRAVKSAGLAGMVMGVSENDVVNRLTSLGFVVASDGDFFKVAEFVKQGERCVFCLDPSHLPVFGPNEEFNVYPDKVTRLNTIAARVRNLYSRAGTASDIERVVVAQYGYPVTADRFDGDWKFWQSLGGTEKYLKETKAIEIRSEQFALNYYLTTRT